MDKIKVAAAQIEVSENPQANLEKILEYLSDAKKQNAALVVFPETCIYPKFDGIEKSKLNPILSQIEKKCKELKIWAVVGVYVKEVDIVKNVAHLINSNGKIVHSHYKTRKWESEEGITCEPSDFPVLDTELGKIGLAICWDISNEQIIQNFRKKGAEIILCPSWIPDGNTSDFAETVPLGLAFFSDAFVIFADSTNDNGGKSAICSPRNFLAKDYGKEALLVAELNPEQLVEMKSLKGLSD